MNSTLIIYVVIGLIISLFLFYNFYTPSVYTYGSVSKDKGKTIFILGSVHGNEPSGTNACYHLIDYLKGKLLKNKVIIMPQPNPIGYYLDSRYQMKPFNRATASSFKNLLVQLSNPKS